jgi:hypothetical protein
MKKQVLFFLQLQNNIQLFHWNTTSFATHKATDSLYKTIVPLVDAFIEQANERDASFEANIHVTNYTAAGFKRYIKQVCGVLTKMDLHHDQASIRDDMVGTLRQYLYLSNLH